MPDNHKHKKKSFTISIELDSLRSSTYTAAFYHLGGGDQWQVLLTINDCDAGGIWPVRGDEAAAFAIKHLCNVLNDNLK
jgi:hypothetical protein